MSFRRIPFQFSSTDPAERQAELEKRFGLPSRNNMYVDVANPLSMSSGKTSESSSSPRLQHRVPIFMEGYDQRTKSSVDSVGSNSDTKKKPNVRVIPIEIEGDCRPYSRHRTFSGPAGLPKEKDTSSPAREGSSPLKRSMQDLSQPLKAKVTTGPKVHNIPIQVEDRNIPVKKPEKVAKPNNSKEDNSKMNGCVSSKQLNGCASSKQSNKVQSPEKTPEAEKKVAENNIEISLKKIEDVLKEFVSYESGVKAFTGSMKDKQYRYLDEMLTRCMLRLDDVDTMGNDNVRSARKGAVKQVQACIDFLESKVNTKNQADCRPADVAIKGDSEVFKADKDEENLDQAPVSEMANGQDINCGEVGIETHGQTDMDESSSEEKAASVMNEVDMAESQSEPIMASKEPEMEMTEDKDENSNTESADEVPEVEMAEGTASESGNRVSGELQSISEAGSSGSAGCKSGKNQDLDVEDIINAAEKVSVKYELTKDSNPVVEQDSSIVDVEISETNISNSDSEKLPLKAFESELSVTKSNEDTSENKIITKL